MKLDFNEELPEWVETLEIAEDRAFSQWEIKFCESLRKKLETYGERATLTMKQEHKLNEIAFGEEYLSEVII